MRRGGVSLSNPVVLPHASMSKPPPLPLAVEFNKAMWECGQLYRSAAEECARFHPDLIKQPIGEFTALMDDLHKALLVKVYVTVAKADLSWTPGERAIAADLFEHVWGEDLEGEALRKAVQELVEKDDNIRWANVLRPFDELPPLRARVGELETLVLRIANIVAKIDGSLHDHEAQELRAIQNHISQHLKRIPVDDAPPHEEAQARGAQAVKKMAADVAAGKKKYERPSSPGKSAETPDVPTKSREELLKEALEELDGLIGLASIKEEVRTLTNFLKMQDERKKHGLPTTEVTLHMVFEGNPGTGKTTVARIIGRIYGALGILEKGHLIETDRSGLVAEYAGQTGPKSNKRIDEALEGVLFIDEAYSLVAKKGDDPYGHEAVQTLLKRMEDDRDKLIVIIAGYPQPMQKLLRSNPGLSSRFSRTLAFPNYTVEELGRIFQSMCDKNRYELPVLTRVKLLLGFHHLLQGADEHFGNGRLARNVFESAIRRLANRVITIAPITKEILTTLEPDDIHMDKVEAGVWKDLDSAAREFLIDCPQCKKESRLPQKHLGKRVKCNDCKTAFDAQWARPAT